MSKVTRIFGYICVLGSLLMSGIAVAEVDSGATREQQLNATINQVRDKAARLDTASANEKAALKAALLDALRQAIANAQSPEEAAKITTAAVTGVRSEAAAITQAAVRAKPAYAAEISGAAAKAAPDQVAAITTAAMTESPRRAAAIQRSVTEAAPMQKMAIYLAAISVPGVNPLTLVAPAPASNGNNGTGSNNGPNLAGTPSSTGSGGGASPI